MNKPTAMSVPLSDTRLAEIRDCWQAATGGRWLVDRHGAFGEATVIADQGEHAATIGSMDFGDGDQADADRTFVMYAHRDVGVLLAEVDRLRAENAGLDDLRLRAIDKNDELRTELRDRRTEDLNLRGLLVPDGLPRRVPMELGASLVPAVDRLLLELERFRDGHRNLFALMQDGQHWDGQRLVSEALLSQRDIRRALHWPAPVAPDGPCECKATSDGSPIHNADASTPTSKEQQR